MGYGGVADLASKVPSVEGHASERLAWFLPSLALYKVRLEVFTIAPDAEVYAHRRQCVWGGGARRGVIHDTKWKLC